MGNICGAPRQDPDFKNEKNLKHERQDRKVNINKNNKYIMKLSSI